MILAKEAKKTTLKVLATPITADDCDYKIKEIEKSIKAYSENGEFKTIVRLSQEDRYHQFVAKYFRKIGFKVKFATENLAYISWE